MRHIQIKNVPAELHRKIRVQAKRQGRTMRDLVLDAVRRELAREEFSERLRRRAPVDLGRPAAHALDEVRSERDAELAR